MRLYIGQIGFDPIAKGDSIMSAGRWFIGDRNDGVSYLHRDGIVRNSTFHNNSFSGYFRTRQDARDTLKKYKASS